MHESLLGGASIQLGTEFIWERAPLLSRSTSTAEGAGGEKEGNTSGKLGTFLGVFVPTMNTIFGVVVFLRWGWAIGQAGVWQVIVMLFVGHVIAILTCCSVSAICTNGEVGPGGAYYLISRALGPEFGGSIGALFYIAQATGVAFYLLGLAETILATYDFTLIGLIPGTQAIDGSAHDVAYWNKVLVSSSALFVIFIISMIGSSVFARASFAIFLVIVAALVSAIGSFVFRSFGALGHAVPVGFVGMSMATFKSNWDPQFTCAHEPCIVDGGGWAASVAVFSCVLPSMTGILAGANMSGDLKNPAKAIPDGTFAAIAVMFISYVLVILVNAAAVDADTLRHNYQIMQDVNFWPPLVFIGTLSTTFSSALSGLVGTARVLQAIADDFPALKWFAKCSARDGEPRRAIVASYVISQATLFLGNVNTIAPFVSNFMLVMFVVLNLACATLELTDAPNFRPRFRMYSWKSALFGAFLCLFSMFLCSPQKASVAVAFVLALFVYLSFSVTHAEKLSTEWGDVTQGLLARWTIKFLLRLDVRKGHAKFWRPNVLLLLPYVKAIPFTDEDNLIGVADGALPEDADDDDTQGDHALMLTSNLTSFAADLARSGLLTIGHVLVGVPLRHQAAAIQAVQRGQMKLVEDLGVDAFSETTAAPALHVGVQQLTLCAGIGALRANTIMFGMHGGSLGDGGQLRQTPRTRDAADRTAALEYYSGVQGAALLGKTVIIACNFESYSRDGVSSLLVAWERSMRVDMAGHGPRSGGRIDVWLPPLGDGALVDPRKEESRVMLTLQLAQVLHSSPFWTEHTRLRCCYVTAGAEQDAAARANLRRIADASRMYFDEYFVNLFEESAFHQSPSVSAHYKDKSTVDAAGGISKQAQDVRLLTAMAGPERAMMLNELMKDHTIRESAVTMVHQCVHWLRGGASSQGDDQAVDNRAAAKAFVSETRMLSRDMPPMLLISPSDELVTASNI